MVTSWLCVPKRSCHAVTVYLPAGSPSSLNAPVESVMVECGVFSTTKYPCIQGCTLHLTAMNSGWSHAVWIGGAPFGCDLFHSALTLARGRILCDVGSSLSTASGRCT